jgi:hypothetical protein
VSDAGCEHADFVGGVAVFAFDCSGAVHEPGVEEHDEVAAVQLLERRTNLRFGGRNGGSLGGDAFFDYLAALIDVFGRIRLLGKRQGTPSAIDHDVAAERIGVRTKLVVR